MEGLKIALVSDWFFPSVGGIEYHLHDLATELVRRGHRVHLITGNGDYPDENLPYKVHRFKGQLTLESFKVNFGPEMLKNINELYKNERFDITHSHSFYSPLAVTVANLSSGIRGVPSLLTGHSLLGDSFLNPFYVRFLRIFLHKIHAFIAVSGAVKRDLEAILGKNSGKRKIHVIPNGINTDFWKPAADRWAWKKRLGWTETVVITVSRLTKRKRVHLIPRLAREIRSRYGRRVIFLIIGDGPERRNIQALIREYGVEDTVKLLGRRTREEVRAYLQASDIYLSPTIYEAFGIAALEAMACGVPVVANNHGGISEVVEHGATGLVSYNDEELRQHLQNLIENEDLRREMGQKARRRAEERFSWKRLIPEIVRVYEDTLSSAERRLFMLYLFHQMLRKRARSCRYP